MAVADRMRFRRRGWGKLQRETAKAEGRLAIAETRWESQAARGDEERMGICHRFGMDAEFDLVCLGRRKVEMQERDSE